MKIGIVTAYDENEANSEYSKALKNEFERQGHTVEILRLPFNIFRNASKSAQNLADNIINDSVQKIQELDYVNIQYEFILFGTDCCSIRDRIFKLIDACKEKSFSFTVHSRINFDYKKLKKGKMKIFLEKLLRKKISFKQRNIDRIQYQIIEKVYKNGGLIIMHTVRDKNKILAVFPNANVQAFPLSYKCKEDILSLKEKFNSEAYEKDMGMFLPKNCKKIGVLGAFMPWKDFASVVYALDCLPEEYHLFFFGGQHKIDFKGAPSGLDSTQNLLNIIRDLDLSKRVHFMGYQPSSEDMLNAHLFCDYIVVPYREVGESGSGSASMALETCQNVFLTRNECFEELKNFCGEAVFNYDMGNYLELAEKIASLPNKERIYSKRKEYFEKYNVEENVKMYLSGCGE